jgi:hypothetical protein
MIRRSFTTLSLLVLAAAPLAAQTKAGDPDKKVDGGALPAGWEGRTDNANAKLSDAKFVAPAGGGYFVTSGPAAIYWRTTDKVTGPFTATATFHQLKAPAHPEAFGIFFMGKSLTTADQNYAYMLVRGDGKVMVKHRAGKDVHTIIDWTDNAAVGKQDANGASANTLTVDASRSDSVRLLVNGKQVAAIEGSHLGGTDGYVGLRVNHNLAVHVAELTVTPKKAVVGKAPAARKSAAKIAKAKA